MNKLYLFFFCLQFGASAFAQYTPLAPMPEPVSNNAVVAAEANGKQYVYSFCGINSTKLWSGIHLKAWRYDVENDVWSALPDVPDPAGGKIAASANFVKGKIYVIGGYHVASNGNETSSKKVHVFDPSANAWLPDAADIPVAIDDQVQAVWRDSLIYVVTGWSNTTNVANVQIFNPLSNEWLTGTALPNNTNYKVFGGAGTIIGDTIYYVGGAKIGSNLPATTYFRKGIINPNNPTEITWTGFDNPAAKGYRMAAATLNGKAVWFGGSDVTYNYNGIAYNGSGGVAPLDRITVFDPMSSNFFQNTGNMPPVMDLRGIGQMSDYQVIIAGGMKAGQQVTDEVWRIQLDNVLGTETNAGEAGFPNIFPNPASQFFTVQVAGDFDAALYDEKGSLLFRRKASHEMTVPVWNLLDGVYWLDITTAHGLQSTEKVIVK